MKNESNENDSESQQADPGPRGDARPADQPTGAAASGEPLSSEPPSSERSSSEQLSGGAEAPTDPTRIDVDQFLPHPPKRVWRALTTPELMERWLMPNDFEPRVGHRFTFQSRPIEQTKFSGTIACEVLDLVPEQRLSISWEDAEPATDTGHSPMRTTVTWTLTPEGHGTRLFLEHVGFNPDDPTQQLAHAFMGGGWRSHVLRRLEELLASDDARLD